MKQILTILLFVVPLFSFSQTRDNSLQNEAVQPTNFQDYCKKNAISYLEVSVEKMQSINFIGELESLEKAADASYLDYGIELKEGETQYFKLRNSNKVLSVKSLYHLRLNFSNTTIR